MYELTVFLESYKLSLQNFCVNFVMDKTVSMTGTELELVKRRSLSFGDPVSFPFHKNFPR